MADAVAKEVGASDDKMCVVGEIMHCVAVESVSEFAEAEGGEYGGVFPDVKPFDPVSGSVGLMGGGEVAMDAMIRPSGEER